MLLHVVALGLALPAPVRHSPPTQQPLQVRMLPSTHRPPVVETMTHSGRTTLPAPATNEVPASEDRRGPALIASAHALTELAAQHPQLVDAPPEVERPRLATGTAAPGDALAGPSRPPPASAPALQKIDLNAAMARYHAAQQQLRQQGIRGQHLAWLRQRVTDLLRETASATTSGDSRCIARGQGESLTVSCDDEPLTATLKAASDDLRLFLGTLIESEGRDGLLAFQWIASAGTFVQELPPEDGTSKVTATSSSSAPPSP